MFRNARIALICFVLGLVAISCNREYTRVAKSNDMDLKFERAKEYYNNGDCFKAIPLFEELITYYKGSRDLEGIYYSYAYCHYIQKEYIIAAYHFERFIQLYPRSKDAEEASFMIAKCNHQQSPKYNLDQTPTLRAIQQYQKFTQRFPNSEKIAEANQAIDALRLKLHKKAFDNAMLYYKLKDYQAAATAFNTMVEDYPEAKDAERANFYVVMAKKLFADNSYLAKKKERYEETITAYEAFKSRFPESSYLSDLNKVYQKSQEALENLPTTTNKSLKQHERGN